MREYLHFEAGRNNPTTNLLFVCAAHFVWIIRPPPPDELVRAATRICHARVLGFFRCPFTLSQFFHRAPFSVCVFVFSVSSVAKFDGDDEDSFPPLNSPAPFLNAHSSTAAHRMLPGSCCLFMTHTRAFELILPCSKYVCVMCAKLSGIHFFPVASPRMCVCCPAACCLLGESSLLGVVNVKMTRFA